jgi:hypothetical protein
MSVRALKRERERRAAVQADDAFAARLTSLARTAPRAQPGAALAYARTGREVRIDADPIVSRQAISNATDAERRARAKLPSLQNQANIAARRAAIQAQQPKQEDDSIFGSFKNDFLAPIGDFIGKGVELTQAPGENVRRGTPLEDIDRSNRQASRTVTAAAEDALGLVDLQYGQVQNASFGVADRLGIPHADPMGSTVSPRMPRSPRDLFPLVGESRSDDAGDGYFVAGAARERATAIQRETRGSVDGHAGTVGRWIAAQYVDPDNKAYDFLSGSIDFYKAVYADPTNIALAGAAGAVKGRRLFSTLDEAGGYTGINRFVHGPTVEQHLASQQWVDTSHAFAREDDFLNLWEKTGGKLGADATAQITKTKDPTEVTDIARQVLGVNTREVPRLKSDWRQIVEPPRWMSKVPGQQVHIEDTDRLVTNVDLFMKNLRMPRDMRSQRMFEVASAAGDPGATFNAVYKGVMEDARAWLVSEYHVPAGVADELTTAVASDMQAVGKWEARVVGDKLRTPYVQQGDEVIDVTGPTSLSELMDVVYFPDPRAIRRRASIFYRIVGAGREVEVNGRKVFGPLAEMEAKGVALGAHGADLFNRAFKPLALITRLAYPIRVQSELQIRGAVAGLDTSLHHPAGAFAWAMGNGKGAKKYNAFFDLIDEGVSEADALKQLDLKTSPNTWKNWFQAKYGRGGWTMEGEAFEASGVNHDMFDDGMSPLRSSLSNGGGKFNAAELDRVQFAGRDLFPNGDKLFGEAAGHEIAKLTTDPIYREVARALNDRAVTSDSVVDWLYRGKGRPFLEKFARSDMETWGGMLDNPDRVHEFLHDIVADRIIRLTGGDADLVGAIANSRFGGKPLYEKDKLNGDLRSYLNKWKTSQHAPTVVYGDKAIRNNFKTGGVDQFKDVYKKVTGAVFDWMASRPENFFIRHPTMRQFYFNRASELAPWADEATLAKWVENARKANMPEPWVADLARTKRSQAGTVPGDILDNEAQLWAARKTNDLLWSSESRLQFFDMARFFFPFGDAWGEVIKSWTKLTATNPRVLRRGQQIVQGAQGAGVFYESPETGEQVFRIPMSGWLNEKLSGIPVDNEVPVQSLNVGMTGLPGVGPAIAMPIDKMIPNKPEWDTFRETILPYGAKEIGNPLEIFLPAWMAKYQAAGKLPYFKPTQEQIEQKQKNTSYAATYLMSTGAYDQGDAASMRKLQHDAEEAADMLMLVRGSLQFASPGPPSFRWKVRLDGKQMVIDKDGETIKVDSKTGQRLADLRVVSDYYRQLQEEFDYESDAALQLFDELGPDLAAVMQPATRSSIYGLPYGTEAYDWVRNNPDIPDDYPEIYGLFAPDGGEFDMRAYKYSERRDEREVLTGDEFWRLSNHRIAESIYGKAREAAGPTPNDKQRKMLADLRAQLSEDFADWDHPSIQATKPFLDGTEGAEQFVGQFRAAAKDPRLVNTPQAEALSIYLDIRDQAIEAYGGNGWSTSKRGAKSRAVLANAGRLLVEDFPEFAPMWDQVFSREGLLDDVEEEGVLAG